MTLVAVTPSKFVRGVGGRDTDWRLSPEEREAVAAQATNEADAEALRRGTHAAFDVLELEEALRRTYDTDAHLVTYVVSYDGVPLARQPRVNKPALEWVIGEGYELGCDVLFVDLDNPEHADWTPGAVDRALELYATLPVLSTCGVYHTTHGARLVQPLDEPVSVSEVERYLEAWLDELEQAGLEPDRACRDWTRLFRLPHVRRGHAEYRSPLVDLSRMRPRRLQPAALRPKAAPPRLAAGRPRGRLAPSPLLRPRAGRVACP